MNVTMDDLLHEIGSLHMQSVLQQRQLTDLAQQNTMLRQQLQAAQTTKPESGNAA